MKIKTKNHRTVNFEEYRKVVHAGLIHTYGKGVEHFPNDDIEFCIYNDKAPGECVAFLGIKYKLTELSKKGDTEQRWRR